MIKHVTVAIAIFAAPVIASSGCANQAADNSSTSTTSGSASSAQTLTAQLNTADGDHVADATIEFTNGYATVTVETVGTGILSPGLHGLHIHAVGKCEGDFTSAGDHFQAPGHTGQPASGDLPSLLVRSDGAGKLVATSDSFTEDQLKGSDGSAILLHQASGEDAAAGRPIACGVLSPASASTTSVSTSTETSTVTTTAPATVPPTTSPTSAAETTTSAPPTSSSSVAPSTSTSTVTVIQPPTIPAITVPPLPGTDGG